MRQPHIPAGFLLPLYTPEKLAALPPAQTVGVIIREGEGVKWSDNDNSHVDMDDPWIASHIIDLRLSDGRPGSVSTCVLELDTEGRSTVSSSLGYDVLFVSRTAGALLSDDQIRRLVTYNVNDPAWFIERYGVAKG